MAPVILKENLTRVDIVATVVIVSGTVLSVAFGSKESTDHDISERACMCPLIVLLRHTHAIPRLGCPRVRDFPVLARLFVSTLSWLPHCFLPLVVQ